MQKYKLTWRDIKFDDFKVYFFALFKAFIPKKKIKNFNELEEFIQDLDVKTFNKIQKFYETIPRLYHELKYTNSLGNERVVRLETLNDFLTLG